VHFTLLDSLSLPGDSAKPNEDSFAHTARMAVVFDGATGLGERLMPGASDAQWIAQFAVRRLRAYAEEGENGPREWLHDAAFDAATSFEALRRRAPLQNYEIPCGSLMLVALKDEALDLFWFGDCAALLRAPSGAISLIGDTLEKRMRESGRAAKASKTPAGEGVREEFLPALRAARNHVNTKGGDWLFAPDPACADHARSNHAAAEQGSVLLLASDGFLALSADYRRYTPEELLDTATSRGLDRLGKELRAIEAEDPEGRAFPRFKRCDDATALLLSIGPQKG
jgi:serine/threonine protein phosphatase PrpC